MEFNPRSITEWAGILGGFLSGSLMVTSFLIFAVTESVMVFILMLLFMLVGILTLLHTLLRFGKEIQFMSIIVSLVIGGLVSLALFSMGFEYAYLLIVILLTAFHLIKIR